MTIYVFRPFDCTRNCIRWYQSFGFQMALCEGECFLVRRVADRCIDKNIGDSRVRGDRLNRDHRSAGRGNENGNRDPGDILKIKRLRQQVRDLELRHEIQQLKQRIRDLEDSSSWKETEPEKPVWDELTGDEEHPIRGDFIYHSPPCFDNYEDEEVSREDYLWVTNALNGSEDDESGDGEAERNDGLKTGVDVGDGVVRNMGKKTIHSGDGVAARGGPAQDSSGSVRFMNLSGFAQVSISNLDDHSKSILLEGGRSKDSSSLVSNSKILIAKEVGSVVPQKMDITNLLNISSKIPNIVNNLIAKEEVEFSEDIVGDQFGEDLYSYIEKVLDDKKIELPDEQVAYFKFCECMDVMHTRGLHTINISEAVVDVGSHVNSHLNIKKKIGVLGPNQAMGGKGSVLLGLSTSGFGKAQRIRFGPNPMKDDKHDDPGDTSFELGQMTREVRMYMWLIMLIINGIRFDFPFDPGGFDPKTKLEDEFFSKTGSMMQDIYEYYFIFISNFSFLIFCYLVTFWIMILII
ncbi:hypothetical protein HanIR_Chr01g0045501 [Helianthus annuus]|nr:hypothetical protein HanIR_Chr01g0045501 [Helianthus annuus]